MSATRVYPLAPSQETIWEFMRFISPQAPGRAGVNASAATWLRGPLDVDRLSAAVAQMASRHDALRICFVDVADRPAFRIVEEAMAPLSVVDLSDRPEPDRREAALRLVAAADARAFDLVVPPLWEVRLIRLSADHHVLVVSMSHLIGDGSSAHLLLRDLGAAYGGLAGHGPGPAPVRLRYADVLAAESRRRVDPAVIDHWRDRLTPLPAAHPMASSVLDTGIDPNHAASTPFRFMPDLPGRLTEVAARWRTTPFITLLGVYRALLGAWTGWDRVILGTTTLGRGPAGARELIGQFTTNTYLAVTVRPEATLREAVAATHAEMVAALRHATSFFPIARAVHPEFDRHRPWPFLHLYDAWFQSDVPSRPPRFPGLTVVAPAAAAPDRDPPPRAAPGRGVVDPARRAAAVKRQTPWILLDADCRGGTVEYGPAYFTAGFAAGWSRLFQSVAAAVVDDPDRRIRDLRLLEPAAAGWPEE